MRRVAAALAACGASASVPLRELLRSTRDDRMTIGSYALEQCGDRSEHVLGGKFGAPAVERRLRRIFNLQLDRPQRVVLLRVR